MTGPERRDESVAFSLRELMKLEDERVDQETRSREARELSSKRAREEAELRERAELAARERLAAEERERAQRLEREEEARHEAMQRAAVEQVRITVEARTRAEESERERRHELELQRMRLETHPKPGLDPRLAGGLVLVLSVAASLALHLLVTKPAAEGRALALERASARAESAETRAGELERRVEEQSQKLADLSREVDLSRAKLAARPTEGAVSPNVSGLHLRDAPRTPGTGSRGGRATAPLTPPADKPCANRFDPLCGHIP